MVIYAENTVGPQRESALEQLSFITKINKCASSPGPDTKLMQNSGKTTFKRTSIDRLMNVLVLVVSLINVSSFLQMCSSFPDAPPLCPHKWGNIRSD